MTTYLSMSDTVVSMVRDPFLNTGDASGYLGVPKATLLTWRTRRPGYGPRAVRAGGRLKYRLSELNRWLAAHEESFTDEQVEAAQAIEAKPAAPPRKVVRTRTRADRVQNSLNVDQQPPRRVSWPGRD
jgi:hypothetical protein